MKNIFILLSLSVLFSCTPSPETKFNKLNVSFTCPSGWKITEEEAIDSTGYYLSCEKKGLDASGLITISWIKDTVDLEQVLTIYQDELKGNIIYKNADLKFGKTAEAAYHHFPAIVSDYTMSLLGVKHRGVICCFYGKSKTITILEQEALEDTLDNKEGLKKIEDTFVSK